MTVQFMSLFFALLSLLVVVVVAALAVDAVTPNDLGVIRTLRPLSIEMAAAIATTCMLGSLYMSEIAEFDPCRLCWVQRFFMYPAALILIVTAFVKNAALRWVAFGLSLVGMGVSIFHRYEQALGSEHAGAFCAVDNPCSDAYVLEFGFITIPTMAGIGFAGVMALILLHNSSPK